MVASSRRLSKTAIFTESVALSPDGRTVIRTFADTPGDHYLLDGQCYTITLATDTVSPALGGAAAVTVRSLAGDTSGNGSVNLGDALYTRSKIGQPVDTSTAAFDVDLDGTISLSDVLAIKTQVSSPAVQIPCP